MKLFRRHSFIPAYARSASAGVEPPTKFPIPGVPLLNQILNDAKAFKFYFHSENLETNAFELESTESDYIRKNGNLPELNHNRSVYAQIRFERLTPLNPLEIPFV
jgi:hypothetical protein